MRVSPRLPAAVFATLLIVPGAASAQALVPLPGTRPIDLLPKVHTANDSLMLIFDGASLRALQPLSSDQKSALIKAPNATAESTFTIKTRSGLERGFRRFKTTLINNGEWCNPVVSDGERPNRLKFCHFYSSSTEASKAAQIFWNGYLTDGSDVAFTRVLNLVGNDNAQSTKVELLSDLWNTIRVGFSGVVATKTSSESGAAKAAANANRSPSQAEDAASPSEQSKAQQFLNGGGPASLRLDRPFFVLDVAGTNTVVLGHAAASFAFSGTGASPADSMQFASTGFDVQSRVDGAGKKVGGIAHVHVDRIYGGRSFYRAATSDTLAASSFATGSFSVGLLLEQRVQLTWNKIFFGPRALQKGASFFTVNVTR